MTRYFAPLLFFALAPAVFGQLESDTLSITASRQIESALDHADVVVAVSAPVTLPFDRVVEALRPVGVTAANLVEANATPFSFLPSDSPRTTDWYFRIPATFANLSKVVAALAEFPNPAGMAATYYLQPAYPAAACPWQTLLSDAQTQAQKLASSAAVRLGPIVSISDRDDSGRPQQQALFYVGIARFGFVGPAPDKCSLTVRFKLLR